MLNWQWIVWFQFLYASVCDSAAQLEKPSVHILVPVVHMVQKRSIKPAGSQALGSVSFGVDRSATPLVHVTGQELPAIAQKRKLTLSTVLEGFMFQVST